jgi:hypothetical protein
MNVRDDGGMLPNAGDERGGARFRNPAAPAPVAVPANRFERRAVDPAAGRDSPRSQRPAGARGGPRSVPTSSTQQPVRGDNADAWEAGLRVSMAEAQNDLQQMVRGNTPSPPSHPHQQQHEHHTSSHPSSSASAAERQRLTSVQLDFENHHREGGYVGGAGVGDADGAESFDMIMPHGADAPRWSDRH